MAINWVQGFIIPIIKTVFIGGILLIAGYYVYKGFSNAYNKSFKFFLKYQFPLIKKPYPVKTVEWCYKCIDNGIGYYEAKKMLMIKMYPQNQINETMWIFDQLITELGKKGGVDKNGRKLERHNKQVKGSTESADFPDF